MAFFDEGTPRWDTCIAGGSGDDAVTATTEEFLLVEGDKDPGDKYTTVKLTNPADAAAANTMDIYGVTAGGSDTDASMDPYELKSSRKIRIKTSKKLRCRTATAYVAANHGQKVVPSHAANEKGWGNADATNGQGRIVGGETIGTGSSAKHYLDFFIDESS